jgi:CII-binding regulator of phage lambda lysogenization HflD
MTGTHALRYIGTILLAGTCIAIVQGGAGVITAQAPRSADTSDAAVSALVSELRALRTQLTESSQRGLRLQLLIGRIQMQEQRIAHLDRQRSEVTAKLSEQMSNLMRMRGQIQVVGTGCDPSIDRRECENMIRAVKTELATQEAAEQRLRAQEADLTNAVSAEQGRWSDFNARLDELDRSLSNR